MLTSTNITAQSGKKYSDVLGKLDDFFEVIYERAQLNQRLQWEDKIVEQYITPLYRLVEDCKFGDTKDTLICDRLAVSIRDITCSNNSKQGLI